MSRSIAVSAIALAIAATVQAAPAAAQLSLGISVGIHLAPPPLPVYAQPPLPGPDYIWVPGYWAWDGDFQDYYWVPGTWAMAPRPGLLWTPAWWGWSNGGYMFHSGYWGPRVGFYGGIAYGFGYTGFGYAGGYWQGGHVFYNNSVNNITNVHVTNVYNQTIVNNHITRVSFNGGPGGVNARATPDQIAAMREPHLPPTANQQQHVMMARDDRQSFASTNRGLPPIAATPRPRQFAAGVPARGAPGAAPASFGRPPHAMNPMTQGSMTTQRTAPMPRQSFYGNGATPAATSRPDASAFAYASQRPPRVTYGSGAAPERPMAPRQPYATPYRGEEMPYPPVARQQWHPQPQAFAHAPRPPAMPQAFRAPPPPRPAPHGGGSPPPHHDGHHR